MTLASASTDNATVLHLVHRRVQTTDLDLGEKGSSQGDQMVFADDVFRKGKKVGTAGGACTATRVTPSAIQYLCQASVRLPEGQLSGQLLASTSQTTLTYAIIGGTGAYRDVGGYARVPNTQSATYPVTIFVDHLGS
jgi:allene oxide cyclase-like protein